MDTYENKISVIIPVYHAENYIREALDSVLAQSYRNMEILIVENSGEERSMEILKEYTGKQINIKVLSCADRGAGVARNAGLSQATGEYVLFVDADDYLPDAGILENYMKAARQTDADIILGNYARLWENRILPAAKHRTFSIYSPTSEEFRFQGFFGVGTLSYVWGRLYRRAFLLQHQITFHNLTYAEDKLFNMQCYLRGARYLFMEEIGYIYRKNKDSISWQYHEDATQNWLKMAHILKEWMKEQSRDMTEYENMIWYTIFFASFFDSKMEYVEKKKSLKAMKKVLKQYNQDTLGREAFQKLAGKSATQQLKQRHWRMVIRMFSAGMKKRWYTFLAAGIRILIELRMDERFSDTGIRKEPDSES